MMTGYSTILRAKGQGCYTPCRMEPELNALTILLGLIWSLMYWIAGGVMFALISLLRLGRVRKVRFSCLFTLLAFACGSAAAYLAVSRSQGALNACLVESKTQAETLVALFGCGFGQFFLAFLLGAAALVSGGFLAFALSSTKTKPWVDLKAGTEGEEGMQQGEEPDEPVL